MLVLLPTAAWSQQPGMTRAFDLERRGDYAGAADAYRAVLAGKPADLAALLGLERLLPLNRSPEILPVVRTALAAAPSSSAVYGIALRAWAAADQPDSVRSTAERWARIAPTEEAPYREWGAAELGRQNRSGARAAYLRGRERLGRADALAAELAQLSLAEGDYAEGLREWLLAVRRLPGYRATAVATLAQAPELPSGASSDSGARSRTSSPAVSRPISGPGGATRPVRSGSWLRPCPRIGFNPVRRFAACSISFAPCGPRRPGWRRDGCWKRSLPDPPTPRRRASGWRRRRHIRRPAIAAPPVGCWPAWPTIAPHRGRSHPMPEPHWLAC